MEISSENSGESSQKVEHEAESSERPLKKARYVWEVKGKYHLKEALNKSENKPEASAVRIVEPENIDDSENNNVLINNNEEACCRESFVAHAETIMSECESSIYSQDDSSDEERTFSSDSSAFANVPVTMVSSKTKDYDYYLTRWQTRHIARGFVDNTINHVIESYSADTGRSHLEFLDVCEVVKHYASEVPNFEVEDEGITMAIQSHGLQAQDALVQSCANKMSCSLPVSCDMNPQDDQSDKMDDSPHRDNMVNESRNDMVDSRNADLLDSMSCDSMNHQDQDDFMNAAVSAAIQNKGLSSTTY